MTDQQQLALLQQGVDGWNQWRKENPDVRPDLSGANLSRADLRGMNLSGVDLRHTNLAISAQPPEKA